MTKNSKKQHEKFRADDVSIATGSQIWRQYDVRPQQAWNAIEHQSLANGSQI